MTEQPSKNDLRLLLQLALPDKDPSIYGTLMGIIVNAFQIIIFFLLLYHIFSKSKKKNVLTMAPLRFIFVTFSLTTPWIVGQHINNTYRGLPGIVLQRFFFNVYNGYFNSGYLKIFRKIEDSNGNEYPGDGVFDPIFYLNCVFVETILLLIFGIITLAMLGKMKKFDLQAHFLGSIFPVFFYCWSFYFFTLALLNFKQHRDIYIQQTKGFTYKRRYFWNVISFFISIIMVILTALSVVWIYVKMFEEKKRREDFRLMEKKENMDIKKDKENLNKFEPFDYNTINYSYKHEPKFPEREEIEKEIKETHQEIEELKKRRKTWRSKLPRYEFMSRYVGVGIGLMHLENKDETFADPIAIIYNGCFYFRLLIVVLVSVLLRENMKTAYWIFMILDLIFLGLAVKVSGFAFSLSKILIILVEVFHFLFHLGQLLFFYDISEDGKSGKFKKNFVWFIALVIFFSILLILIIEIILLLSSFSHKQNPVIQENIRKINTENLKSEDSKLAKSSFDELGNKIDIYNTLKSKNLSRLDENHVSKLSHSENRGDSMHSHTKNPKTDMGQFAIKKNRGTATSAKKGKNDDDDGQRVMSAGKITINERR